MKYIALLAFPAALALAGAARCKEVVQLDCSSDGKAHSFALPVDELHVQPGPGATWLEVEEDGQVVEFAAHDTGQLNVPQPLRYGWRWSPIAGNADVVIRRVEHNAARGAVRVTVHCGLDRNDDARLAWLRDASAVAPRLNRTVDVAELPSVLEDVDRLVQTAVDQRTRSFALHLRAQALMVNGKSADAAAAFAEARAAWVAVGDRERAVAALVGQVGELYRMGAYSSVMQLTTPLEEPATYFIGRLQNTRCLSLQALNRLDEADACYERALAVYSRLGESAEYVAELQNRASLFRDRGQPEKAVDLGERALHAASGSDASMVRGRILVMLADLAVRRGNVAAAIAQLQDALIQFGSATQDVRRWQANVYLQLSALYAQLGAYSEAYDAIAAAVARISARDAPTRMAVAMETFADIERETRHLQSAEWWQLAAQGIYSQLGMSAEVDRAQAALTRIRLQNGSVAAAEQALTRKTTAPRDNSTWQLIAAEVAVHRGRGADAREWLVGLQGKPMSLRDQVWRTQIDAELRDRSGQAESAQRLLFDAASNMAGIARRATSPVLGFLVERQLYPLERKAMQLALRQSRGPSSQADAVNLIWKWLASPEIRVAAEPAARSGGAANEAFDRAVAAALLPQPGNRHFESDTAQRELLVLLAQGTSPNSTGRAETKTAPNLADLQRALPPDTGFIAYVDADDRGAVLWVTAEAVRLTDAADPASLRGAVASLQAQLRSADNPVGQIEQAAEVVTAQLLGGLRGIRLPRHLWVFDDELSSSIPWTTLVWPESAAPLVLSTTVDIVHLADTRVADRVNNAKTIHVVVAFDNGAGGLANLPAVAAEPSLISTALATDDIDVLRGRSATSDAVRKALSQDGSWVHIAAHGTSNALRIGYSGLWLDSAATEEAPEFLSWVDVLDSSVRSSLVVLNACSLGERGDSVGGNLGFAEALSRAGAQRVVASLWPVSDAAASLWVSTFYDAMRISEGRDAPEALRQAQLRLRSSRAFAHPFFWSGMQVFSGISLASTGTAP